MKLFRSNKIEVRDSSLHGKGVFALEKINFGELIEECHIILVPIDYAYPEILKNYFFSWPKCGNLGLALVLGNGSIFNHSSTNPNVDYTTQLEEKIFSFYARKEIFEGEELLIDYGYSVDF